MIQIKYVGFKLLTMKLDSFDTGIAWLMRAAIGTRSAHKKSAFMKDKTYGARALYFYRR